MKRILTTLSQKWPEYLLEIIVITVGILGAFALNNWNENNKEKESEKRFLLNLRSEIIENQMSLEYNIELHKNIYDHIVHFISLTGPDATNTDQTTFDSLVYSSLHLPSYDPVKGSISSSELDDLEADQLKALIAKWNIKVDDYHRAVEITYDLYYNFIYPELSQHYTMKTIKGAENSFDLKSKFVGEQIDLLRNIEFENHLTMRAINAKNIYARALEIDELEKMIIKQINVLLKEL